MDKYAILISITLTITCLFLLFISAYNLGRSTGFEKGYDKAIKDFKDEYIKHSKIV